jgi:hypothetical protein
MRTRTFNGVVMTFICAQTIHPRHTEVERYRTAADGRTAALKATGRYSQVRRVKQASPFWSGWRYEWFGVRVVKV